MHIKKEAKSLNLPKPLIDGNDLIRLGYKPGRIFTKIINRVVDLQLEGMLSSKEEAIEFVLKEFHYKRNL